MERTTGFEPATLTLAKVILFVHQLGHGLLACPSIHSVFIAPARFHPRSRASTTSAQAPKAQVGGSVVSTRS